MNEVAKTGKGSYSKRNWEEIRKGGGIAPDVGEISRYLQDGGPYQLTRDEVMERIKRFFDSVITVEELESGECVSTWIKAPTKADLAMCLGVDPSTLARYAVGYNNGNAYTSTKKNRSKINPDDFDLVRKAYTVIESYYEGKLSANMNTNGIIFWLLNVSKTKWSNENEVVVSAQKGGAWSEELPTREEIASRVPQIAQKEPEIDTNELLEELGEKQTFDRPAEL